MDILTPSQFAQAKPGTVRNHALKRGGSVDVGIAGGKVIVGSKRDLTPEELAEVATIVEAFTKRHAQLSKEKAVDGPQEGRAIVQPPTK
jgi:hypothetical protein